MAVLSIFFITTSADSCFAKFMFCKIQQTKILCKIPQTKFKNSKLWRRKKLGFCKDSTNVASITDLPVEVDKALIEADVSLQNVDAWAKKSLESVQVIKYWFSLEKWNQNVKFRYIQVMKNKNVLNFGAMLGLSIKERWFRFKEVLVCAYCLYCTSYIRTVKATSKETKISTLTRVFHFEKVVCCETWYLSEFAI